MFSLSFGKSDSAYFYSKSALIAAILLDFIKYTKLITLKTENNQIGRFLPKIITKSWILSLIDLS